MSVLSIAGIQLSINSYSDDLLVLKEASSRHFFLNEANSISNYCVNLFLSKNTDFARGPIVLNGEPWADLDMPYSWFVHDLGVKIGIEVQFEGHPQINSAMAVIDFGNYVIDCFFDVKERPVALDLFQLPLGILLMVYLVNRHKGLMLHASGIDDKGKGYLFTGISGIGKSTMANLWREQGSTVINDDRLVVMLGGRGWQMHNTPMPYYLDSKRMVGVNGIFLLSQSTQNRCKQITGTAAVANVLANCIQHLHSPNMVQAQLDIVCGLVDEVPVYELGFKPDGDVVALIKSLGL